ncbi:protein phosphatase 2C domain-containing protein [Paenibacillus sp. FSL W8-0919]|uniref:PP2C family protein-serine/threonine phosphatase n=1 Tax=Paenibacillus sp. FSL W8-0919 TaxID=2954707 RepID=UPI0030F80E55
MRGEEYVPYVVTLLFAAALILLVICRQRMLRREDRPAVMIGNGQTIGRRPEQDDYFSSVSTDCGTLAVLADGISGLAHGRMASTVAVSAFIREFIQLENGSDLPSYFTRAARISNREILHRLRGGRGGTTLVAAVVQHSKLYWGAVGDSTISVFRNGQFIPMNSKHILEYELEARYLAGEITREAIASHPMRKRLVNYLGFDGFKNLDISPEPFTLRKGDKVLLLSDGVYNALTELELEEILTKRISPNEAAEEIIQAVEDKGYSDQDNATVVILEQMR